jgi:adenosylhomocysteine nucleosidase
MNTLVCFALKEEAAPFHQVAAAHPGVITFIAGIGRQNAEKSVRSFLRSVSPRLVFTCGFAGGLNPNLKIGDVVFEFPFRRDEFHESQISPPVLVWDSWNSSLRNKLLAAGAKPAKFFCADRVATTVAEKKKLRAETGADVVEMESAAIHAVCAEKNIPCVTVRVVSDTAGEDLPLDFNALARPDKRLDFGKLAWAIARSPGKIGALMALQKQTGFAARQLARVLDQVIAV